MLTTERLEEINAALKRHYPYLAGVIDRDATQKYVTAASWYGPAPDVRNEQQAWLEDGPVDEVADWVDMTDYCRRECAYCWCMVDVVTGEGHAEGCDRPFGLES
jgi:allantoicase